MGVPRYFTIGAVSPDLATLAALDERLEDAGVPGEAHLALVRRRDEPLVGVTLPGARTARVESGLSRAQWFELFSTYLGVTAVSVLMGAVHLPTGLAVQAVMTLACVVGLVLYYRRPRLEKKIVRMGLPERLAAQWQGAFPGGFALSLVTVPSELFDAAQEAFLQDPNLLAPQAVDRRPVF